MLKLNSKSWKAKNLISGWWKSVGYRAYIWRVCYPADKHCRMQSQKIRWRRKSFKFTYTELNFLKFFNEFDHIIQIYFEMTYGFRSSFAIFVFKVVSVFSIFFFLNLTFFSWSKACFLFFSWNLSFINYHLQNGIESLDLLHLLNPSSLLAFWFLFFTN